MSLGQQASPTAEPEPWGLSPGTPEPGRIPDRISVVVNGNLLNVSSEDAGPAVAIHARHSLSNDIHRTTLYILTALFVLTGAYIIVFGPQDNKYNTGIIGTVLLVSAFGTFFLI
jgi:hypothetical protein